MGDTVLPLRMSKMIQSYLFASPWNKFRPEWEGSASLKLVFTPGSHFLQEHWVNMIIDCRKCKEEKYVLPLILLLDFSSAAHTFLPQLVFLLLTKSQVAVNKAIFVM